MSRYTARTTWTQNHHQLDGGRMGAMHKKVRAVSDVSVDSSHRAHPPPRHSGAGAGDRAAILPESCNASAIVAASRRVACLARSKYRGITHQQGDTPLAMQVGPQTPSRFCTPGTQRAQTPGLM